MCSEGVLEICLGDELLLSGNEHSRARVGGAVAEDLVVLAANLKAACNNTDPKHQRFRNTKVSIISKPKAKADSSHSAALRGLGGAPVWHHYSQQRATIQNTEPRTCKGARATATRNEHEPKWLEPKLLRTYLRLIFAEGQPCSKRVWGVGAPQNEAGRLGTTRNALPRPYLPVFRSKSLHGLFSTLSVVPNRP